MSSTVLTLELLDQKNLYVEYRSPLKGGAYLLPLDTRIGNEEGRFYPGGHSFSASARNVDLKNNILHAQLRSSKGAWWDDELEIVVNVSTASTLVDFSIHFRRCDHLRLEECRNLRVIGQSLLAAEYVESGEKVKDIYFNLNRFIGIHEGAFDRNGQWYSESVQGAKVVGVTLYAVNTETERQMSVDLSKILRVRDGAFQSLRESKSGDLDYDVLSDFSNRKWLANANNIRLISFKQLRVWYLVADCLDSRGRVQESSIQLHKIIGPHDDEMFSFFSEPYIPEDARTVSLNNGILTASFHVKDEKWIQRSFNLAELVTNEGGALVK